MKQRLQGLSYLVLPMLRTSDCSPTQDSSLDRSEGSMRSAMITWQNTLQRRRHSSEHSESEKLNTYSDRRMSEKTPCPRASSTNTFSSKIVFVETLEEAEVMAASEPEARPSWIDPLFAYKRDRKLPDDKREAWRIQWKAQSYVFFKGVLIRKKFTRSRNV